MAEETKKTLSSIEGLRDVGIYHIKGQTNLEFPIDREKCARWNVNVTDVQNALQTAAGGKAFSQMIEGEKTFDIALRWPERLRQTQTRFLDIPVDVAGNNVSASSVSSLPSTPLSGSATGLDPAGDERSNAFANRQHVQRRVEQSEQHAPPQIRQIWSRRKPTTDIPIPTEALSTPERRRFSASRAAG